MKNTAEKSQRTGLIAKLHIISKKMGMSETQYSDFLYDNFEVLSSKFLDENQLKKAISMLEKGKKCESDQWRKRVMASIGAWLRATNREQSADKIKGIACRASGYRDFNAIPDNSLRTLYYEFKRQYKEVMKIQSITSEQIASQVNLN